MRSFFSWTERGQAEATSASRKVDLFLKLAASPRDGTARRKNKCVGLVDGCIERVRGVLSALSEGVRLDAKTPGLAPGAWKDYAFSGPVHGLVGIRSLDYTHLKTLPDAASNATEEW